MRFEESLKLMRIKIVSDMKINFVFVTIIMPIKVIVLFALISNTGH